MTEIQKCAERPSEGYYDLLKEKFFDEFPLLKDLRIRFDSKKNFVRFPCCLGYILSSAVSGSKDPICFVAPNTKNLAFSVAAILALTETKNCFQEWVVKYARDAVKPGSTVAVLPDEGIYEYAGIWTEFPDKFRLKVLGPGHKVRSLPIHEILRLETTNKRSPKGSLNAAFSDFETEPPIDKLLNLKSFGNKSVFDCSVLLLCVQKQFNFFTANLCLGVDSDVIGDLASCITVGTFDSGGRIICDGMDQDIRQPMIGMSNRSVNLMKRARDLPRFTRYVVVDGASKLTNNLQTFDQIANTQKLLVIASTEEFENIRALKDRGCLVWELAAEEILIDRSAEEANSGNESEIDFLPIASSITRTVNTQVFEIKQPELRDTEDILSHLQTRLLTSDEEHSTGTFVKSFYKILVALASVCTGTFDEQSLVKDMDLVIRELKAQRHLLIPEVFDQLQTSWQLLNRVASKFAEGLNPKYSWLQDYLSSLTSKAETAIVVRRSASKDQLHKALAQDYPEIEILEGRKLADSRIYDRLIVIGWPGSLNWNAIAKARNSKTLIFAGYSFELQWLSAYQKKLAITLDSIRMDTSTKRVQLGIEEDIPIPDAISLPRLSFNVKDSGQRPMPPGDLPLGNGLTSPERKDKHSDIFPAETREARYVSFSGERYAYITYGCHIPLLNDVFTVAEGRVMMVRGQDLNVEDIVLFREHGDSDVIQSIARKIAGDETYEKTREVANLWRYPLQKIRADVNHIEKLLASAGLHRTTQTINNWLYEPDVIGPTSIQVLKQIAIATNDDTLKQRAQEVVSAIKEIRKFHLKAGKKLSSIILERVNAECPDGEVSIEFDYGTAYVLTIDYIEEQPGFYPANQVNRLRLRHEN